MDLQPGRTSRGSVRRVGFRSSHVMSPWWPSSSHWWKWVAWVAVFAVAMRQSSKPRAVAHSLTDVSLMWAG